MITNLERFEIFPSACKGCGMALYPTINRSGDVLFWKIEHPSVPEFILDMDTALNFCPNNAKIWIKRMDRPDWEELWV